MDRCKVAARCILFLILFSISVGSEKEKKYSDPKRISDSCYADDGRNDDRCSKSEPNILTRLDGVEVGYTRSIILDGDKTLQLSTLNMKPLIFEIKDFFTDKECEHLINLAQKSGLESSITQQETIVDGVRIMDSNGDKILDFTEMKITIEDNFDIYLDDADLRTIYSDLGIDPNKDDLVTREEMSMVTPNKLKEYMNYLVDTSPTKKSRFSEQAWIFPDRIKKDDLLDKFKLRLKTILGIPPILIDKHNVIQVVHYGKQGHYNAHQDSGSTDQPCCHLHENTKCRICRYITFMVYLNEVEEGGETAFPVANNKTFNPHNFRRSGSAHLNSRCSEANLRVKPEQGKAVLWYNHLIDEETGWLGDLDDFTWHGGCPVIKGTKWILNRWINVSPDKEADLHL